MEVPPSELVRSEQLLCLILKRIGDGSFDENDFRDEDENVITIYDPMKGTFERLPPINDPHCPRVPLRCGCVAVNRKLVLIGGYHPSNGNILRTVYIYDFESTRWSRGADMPTHRMDFACSVSSSTGLIYVAGGFDAHYHPLRVAETYDVDKDSWEILAPMIEERGSGCRGVFIDGKFIVLAGAGRPGILPKIDTSSEIFDPSAGTWTRREDMWSIGGQYCPVAYGDSLYSFTELQVTKYDAEQNVWTTVASLPQYMSSVTCAAQCRDWIFVGGIHYNFDTSQEQISYMFSPLTREWIVVEGDGGEEFEGYAVSAATVEI